MPRLFVAISAESATAALSVLGVTLIVVALPLALVWNNVYARAATMIVMFIAWIVIQSIRAYRKAARG